VPTYGEPSGRGALRPRARLLRTLGNDLISSDKVALTELVKNSYDADASHVVLRFKGPLEEGQGSVEIWDDGTGMDVDTLQSSWLDIATDTKRKNTRSDGGRRVLGEKGIGRLAAARIGDELLLVTRRPGGDEVQLLIDWTDFAGEDTYLDQVEVAWQVGSAALFGQGGAADEVFAANAEDDEDASVWHRERGTVLQMEKLRHAWSRDDFEQLRTALTRLVRPRPGQSETAAIDFQVILDMQDVGEELLDLAGQIEPSDDFQSPHYRLVGSVDTTGSAELTYYQIESEAHEELGRVQLWDDPERAPLCGPFDFELNVWDRDKEALTRTLTSATTGGSAPSNKELKGFRDALNEVAGISVYRDGFRVLPFGEHGDDWLGLDLRRVNSPTRRLSNNQIIGHVFIGADTNVDLRDQSNREGMLAGPAYTDLQTMVLAALQQLEAKRYLARRPPKPADSEPKGGLFDRFSLQEVRAALAASYPGDTQLIELLADKDRDIQEGVAEVQHVLSRYSRLATLGSLIDRVLHDGRTVIARLKNITRFGTRDLAKGSLECDEKLILAQQAMSDTADQADLLSTLFNQIEPFGGRKRGRPKEFPIREVIEKVFAIVQAEADARGVALIEQDSDVNVRLDQSELLTVLLNLVQNAIYWASRDGAAGERSVVLGARRNDDDSVTLIVSDSGPGVTEEVRDAIFDPYFSTKPDGIGLGLSIAGNLVEDIYAGELTLVEDGPLPGATFEATFRKRV
jgi:signal transduction histidine kinase